MENITSTKLFTTRRGTIILGVGAAVLAAIVLLVYLRNYRNSVKGGAEPVSVLVAKSLIQQGTPGDVVGSAGLYESTSIPKDQVKTGALVDPKSLGGTVAATDIFPGQQLTSDEFTAATGGLTQKLAAPDRALAISLGSPNAVGGQLVAGNRVDVWVGFNVQSGTGVSKPVERLLLQNVPILSVGTGGNGGGNVTLRVNPADSGRLIYASQYGTIWLVLRPTVGGTKPPPLQVTAQSLVGTPAIQVGR